MNYISVPSLPFKYSQLWSTISNGLTSFDDVAFRIKTPSGVVKTEGDYEGMVGAITGSSTQSFDLTATETGDTN